MQVFESILQLISDTMLKYVKKCTGSGISNIKIYRNICVVNLFSFGRARIGEPVEV